MKEYMLELNVDPPKPPNRRMGEHAAPLDSEYATILIVDDDIINLEVHEALILGMKHLKSDMALSGAIALELI